MSWAQQLLGRSSQGRVKGARSWMLQSQLQATLDYLIQS